MYELFEHTADLGLRVRAQDLDTLFAEAAKCLFSAIIEDAYSVEPRESTTLSIPGDDKEFLLFDWLRELLYRFEADKWLLAKSEVQVTDGGLSATIWGEPLDVSRHLLSHEVKAITYHELKVEHDESGWLAEVIVDI
jgi:SHS2 domain-containing protein